MSKDTMYNYNSSSPAAISREEYTNVGSSAFQLGTAARAFKDDLEVWDSPSGGTQLTVDVDYEISDIDQILTSKAGYDVYTRVTILNASYQTGSIYITYNCVQSYPDAAYFNSVLYGINVVNGYIYGLTINNNSTDSDHDIDIAAGVATDAAGVKYLSLSSSLTKQIDASFSKGTNQGGLDTGAVANNTWYYFWIIEQDSTSDIDILISASQTSPTMPSGWTAKRRIRGAVLTDGSANILGFRQKDNDFRFNLMYLEVNDTATGTTRNTLALSYVPSNFIGIFATRLISADPCYAIIQETSETDTAPSDTYSDILASATCTYGQIEYTRLTDSSAQIAYRTSASRRLTIWTKGFYDSAQ